MAGRGPAPKDPEQRRRRNKQPEFEELPAEGYKGKVPPLPDEYQLDTGELDDDYEPVFIAVAFRAETKEWYATWSTSPMATKFTAVDWNRLRYVIAPLFDGFIRRPSSKLAAEIRLQEEKLGGTVMDRQRLRVRIADKDEDKKPPARRSRSKSSRAKLQVVQ